MWRPLSSRGQKAGWSSGTPGLQARGAKGPVRSLCAEPDAGTPFFKATWLGKMVEQEESGL